MCGLIQLLGTYPAEAVIINHIIISFGMVTKLVQITQLRNDSSQI